MANDRVYLVCTCGERTLLVKYWPVGGSQVWRGGEDAMPFFDRHLALCGEITPGATIGRLPLSLKTEREVDSEGGLGGPTLEQVRAEIQRLRRDFKPIKRIELGMADWSDLRRSVPWVTDTDARENAIYGVPFVIRPVERAFRIVEDDD
jgi:hypothetical protein